MMEGDTCRKARVETRRKQEMVKMWKIKTILKWKHHFIKNNMRN